MEKSKVIEELLNWEKLSLQEQLSWGFDKKRVEKFKSDILSGVVEEKGGSRPDAEFNLLRRMGFDKKIYITNISGKDAWVVLSPLPIINISSFGIEKIGNLNTTSIGGEIKCQQFLIKNNSKKEYELDNTNLYYTVFFNCDGKWKCPYKDRKIDAKIYDINLLPKNVNESIDVDFVPK